MNKMKGSSSDRISHLPDDVKEKILMCLPIGEAARTSILSRNWRYCWVTRTRLVFDENFCRKATTPPKTELLMAIHQVLLCHRGPIVEFKLSLFEVTSCSEIDLLIPFVSTSDIKKLSLLISGRERYNLPSSIFSCLQLKHLKLGTCVLNPPPRFEGFRRLLSLKLQYVDITSEVFSSLISSCPQLEKLGLFSCKILSSHLELTAPKLTSLDFEGSIRSVSFKNTPKLVRLSINVDEISPDEKYEGVDISNWATVFSGLPAMEFLELSYGCFQLISTGGVPKKLPRDHLSNVKILELQSIYFDQVFEVSSMLCLFRSCPRLEKLTIFGSNDGSEREEAIGNFIAEEGWRGVDMCFEELKEVEMVDIWGTRTELEMLRLLLGRAPVLEKMVIQTIGLMGNNALKFLNEVIRLRRLSPLAQVYWSDPDDDEYYD